VTKIIIRILGSITFDIRYRHGTLGLCCKSLCLVDLNIVRIILQVIYFYVCLIEFPCFWSFKKYCKSSFGSSMVMKIFPKGLENSKVCRCLVIGVFTLPISYVILIQSTY
jgi:hypothetical protein